MKGSIGKFIVGAALCVSIAQLPLAADDSPTTQPAASGRTVVVKPILPDELSHRKDLAWQTATAIERNGSIHLAVASPDGTYKFLDLQPGQYQLQLSVDQNFTRIEGSTHLGPLATGSIQFALPKESNSPLELDPVKLEMANYVIVGSAAPDLSAKTLDGKDIKLSDFHGKYILLDFWATWCQPCIEETPDLKDAFDTFGNDNRFAMIGVNLDDKQSDANDYVKENAMTWPQIPELENNDQPIVRQYGVDSIPSIWLISPEGKVLAKNLRGDNIKSTIAKALNE